MGNKKRKEGARKVLSFILTLTLLFSLSGMSVFATGEVAPANPEPQAPAVPLNQHQIVYQGGATSKGGVKISKTIEGTDHENVFDITLTATAPYSIEELYKALPAAVVIVMDMSYSMVDSDNNINGGTQYKMAEDAANAFIDQFCADAAANPQAKRMLSIVRFNTDAERISGWTDAAEANSAKSLKDALAKEANDVFGKANDGTVNPRTGTYTEAGEYYQKRQSQIFTNIEGGLKLAQNLLAQSTVNGMSQYVIFISDGLPTTYANGDGNTSKVAGWNPRMDSRMSQTSGNVEIIASNSAIDGYFYDSKTGNACWYGTTYSDKGAQKARDIALSLKAGDKSGDISIFSIGINVGEVGDISKLQRNGNTNPGFSVVDTNTEKYEIDSIKNGALVKGTNPDTNFKKWLAFGIASNYYWDGDNPQNLADAFKAIKTQIEVINQQSIESSWVVTDPMSVKSPATVDFLGFYDKDGNLKVGKTSLNGKYANGEENTALVTTANNGVESISWDLKDSGYVLTGNANSGAYTYTLKYRVRLANEIDNFKEVTVDEPGVNSTGVYETNGKTTFAYKENVDGKLSDIKELEFEVPAVHGFLGEFAFQKVSSKTGEPIYGAKFVLEHSDRCSVCSHKDVKATVSWSQTSISNGEGIVEFTEIPSGHDFILSEKAPAFGYEDNSDTYKVKVAYDVTTVEGKAALTADDFVPVATTTIVAIEPGPGESVPTDSAIVMNVPQGENPPQLPPGLYEYQVIDVYPEIPEGSFSKVENTPLNKITVKKDVTGAASEEEFSPKAFKIVLRDAAGEEVETIELPKRVNGELVYEYTVENLQPGTYTIEEIYAELPGHGLGYERITSYSTTDQPTGAAVTVGGGSEEWAMVTNHYNYSPSIIPVTFSKFWVDESNRDGVRPESVIFGLYEEGSNKYIKEMEVGPDKLDVTVDETGDIYTATFTYDSNKYPGGVYVKELGYRDASGINMFGRNEYAVPGYNEAGEVTDTSTGALLGLENVHYAETVVIPVEKIWGADTEGKETDVTFILKADGKEINRYVLTKEEAEANAVYVSVPGITGSSVLLENPWKFVFTTDAENNELSKNREGGVGEAIKYEVVELSLGSRWSVSYDNEWADGRDSNMNFDWENSWVVVNTYNPPGAPRYTSRTVEKVWQGDEGLDVRPESIEVQLYDGNRPYGQEVELSDENGWTYTWTQLSRSGNWSVKEVDVPDGYESSIRNSGTTIVVTNTYEEVIEETTPPGITTTPGITPPDGGGGDIDLFDEDVPLADVPATGDNTTYYALVALVSGVSLLWLNLTGRKNENEQ